MPALIIDETDELLVIVSLENHPLIIPKKHFKDIYELDTTTGAAVMTESIKIANAAKKALQCDGITITQSNEAAGGQDVFHYHMHVKPRWKGDNLRDLWDASKVREEDKQKTLKQMRAALASEAGVTTGQAAAKGASA